MRILAVATFLILMALWADAWSGFVHWLPAQAQAFLGIALIFLCIGALLMRWHLVYLMRKGLGRTAADALKEKIGI